jgi:hypothetical protein
MEFFIRQGASDPILKMRMIDDGKNDKSSFNDILENAVITFDMYDNKTGEPIILSANCNITTRTKIYNQTTDEYYIVYRFTSEQTTNVGKFEGKINVQFRDVDLNPTKLLILPVKEKLYINIF